MTRIETTKDILYHLGNNAGGSGGEGPIAETTREAVRELGRRIAIAAALGPVDVVAV